MKTPLTDQEVKTALEYRETAIKEGRVANGEELLITTVSIDTFSKSIYIYDMCDDTINVDNLYEDDSTVTYETSNIGTYDSLFLFTFNKIGGYEPIDIIESIDEYCEKADKDYTDIIIKFGNSKIIYDPHIIADLYSSGKSFNISFNVNNEYDKDCSNILANMIFCCKKLLPIFNAVYSDLSIESLEDYSIYVNNEPFPKKKKETVILEL